MNKELFKKFMNQAVQKGFAYNLTAENLKTTENPKGLKQTIQKDNPKKY